jgi:hypothetical protein
LCRVSPSVVGGRVSVRGGCRETRHSSTVGVCPAGRFRSGRRPTRCGC